MSDWEIKEVADHLPDILLRHSNNLHGIALHRKTPLAPRVMLTSLRLLRWAVEHAPSHLENTE